MRSSETSESTSESEGGSSGVARVPPEGWARSEAGGFDGVDASDTGVEDTGGLDAGGGTGVRGFRKVKGLGKSKGSVNRALGFAPGLFISSVGAPAATSGVTAAAGVTATAGAPAAKLAMLLAKSGSENVALPCPDKTAGVVG